KGRGKYTGENTIREEERREEGRAKESRGEENSAVAHAVTFKISAAPPQDLFNQGNQNHLYNPNIHNYNKDPSRQVIHPIPGVTLDDIRIDTLLERPSPHVSPITSLLTRQ
ncbi:hypothetical protein ACLOJK_022703, partial [Asimina triloba]